MTELTHAEETANRILAGDRRALSRCVTLLESSREDYRQQGAEVSAVLRKRFENEGRRPAIRIGLSGAPGVGKSTFIETLGELITDQGLSLAVLAIDPSSELAGGSIMGDKTRMQALSQNPAAFIRPSPSGAALGGVAHRTRDVAALCEYAGFKVIMIETVGVGQSEIMVSKMVDLFLLLLAPAGGDSLQGIKRGIMEYADFVLVNKADGVLKDAAERSAIECSSALSLLRPRDANSSERACALTVSAQTGDGIAQMWQQVQSRWQARFESGALSALRAAQINASLKAELQNVLLAPLALPKSITLIGQLARQLEAGEVTMMQAVDRFLSDLRAAHDDPESLEH